jgi:catechol-2,3-dioxygenase
VSSSIAFYQAVFGLGEIENTASNSKTRWLSLGEGKELHLIPRPEAELKTHKAVHFAMALDDMASFTEHLKSLNISFFSIGPVPQTNTTSEKMASNSLTFKTPTDTVLKSMMQMPLLNTV